MKVYIDVIILINFIYDFLILLSVSILLRRLVKVRNVILSSLVGEVSIVCLFFSMNKFILLFFKLLLSIIMCLISFGKKNLKDNLFYMYIITIIIGGSQYLITGNYYKINIISMCIISPLIVYLFIKSQKKFRFEINKHYDVVIIDNGNTYKYDGLMDTGNTLIDKITKYPIVLVNDDDKYMGNKFFYVPYKVVDNSGVLRCLLFDSVVIDGKVIKCLVGLVKNDVIKKNEIVLNERIREKL